MMSIPLWVFTIGQQGHWDETLMGQSLLYKQSQDRSSLVTGPEKRRNRLPIQVWEVSITDQRWTAGFANFALFYKRNKEEPYGGPADLLLL